MQDDKLSLNPTDFAVFVLHFILLCLLFVFNNQHSLYLNRFSDSVMTQVIVSSLCILSIIARLTFYILTNVKVKLHWM